MPKFDVVVLNPPYGKADGGNSRSSVPLYHSFVEMAIDEFHTDFVIAVIPSKWMMGQSINSFKKRMMSDKRIRLIVDTMNPSGMFEEVTIAGGTNYFLWDKYYDGQCLFNGVMCSLDEFDVVIREAESRSILRKVLKHNFLSIGMSVSPTNPYGLRGNTVPSETGVPCWFKQKIGLAFVPEFLVKNERNDIHLWRVIVPKAPVAGLSDLSLPSEFFNRDTVIIAKPQEYCTETFIVLKAFHKEEHAENFVSYLKTRFFRFMLRMRVATQDVTRKNYNYVPDLENYKESWTDKELYKLFDLTEDEQKFIESKIKEFE